jgi:hypothetical protein
MRMQRELVHLQSKLLDLREIPRSPLGLLEERGIHLLRQGVESGGRGELRLAAACGNAALSDLLLKLAKLGQDHLISRTDDNEEIDGKSLSRVTLIQGQRRKLAPLASCGAQLSYLDAMDRQDAQAAQESAAVMTELTELTSDGEANDLERRAHAMALTSLAGALLFAAAAGYSRRAARREDPYPSGGSSGGSSRALGAVHSDGGWRLAAAPAAS